MGEEDVLKMAKSNKDLNEPIVFIEPSYWANEVFDNITQVQAKENPDVWKYRQNSLNIESLTKIVLVVPKKEKQFSQTLKELAKLENIEIVAGKEPLLILEFDKKKQSKTLNFKKELRLLIKY